MDTERAVREFVHDYAETFSDGDPEAIAAHFHEPALLVAERVHMLESRDAVADLFGAILDSLEERGYAYSEAEEVDVEVVADDRARVRVDWVRYTGDDAVLERLVTTHVFRRTGDGWKMIVLLPHD
ncbi:YybH family protein [Halorientalis halophila]|uniref:YybH family protein n=1 Tax=Halorientalis halophila TaxID=3108499 RepID=UPI00300BEF15